MSFAKVYSAQTVMLEGRIIDVEADISTGLFDFSIVGLPDKAVEESKDRVGVAIKNSGFKSPKSKNQKTIISLAPADLKKEGPVFDLAIALAYLLSSKDIEFDPKGKAFLGELSLDGSLKPIKGVLPTVKTLNKKGFKEVYLPIQNAKEASLIKDIEIYGAKNLKEVIDHLNKKIDKNSKPQKIKKQKFEDIKYLREDTEVDFGDVRGQEGAKRGLIISAAGGHNSIMYGPPGTGKTLLAKSFISVLPALDFEEILEVTSIHSIAGTLQEKLLSNPPFRSPHHSSSFVSLVGGGVIPRPGEITLAHRGVLFMDEFPEFERRVIDSLREPLEEKVINVSRARASARFPANFILIAAMNPCPCGNYGSPNKECICAPGDLIKYRKKISGPIADRIDLWLTVESIDHTKLSSKENKFDMKGVKEKIITARNIQKDRIRRVNPKIKLNSEIGVRDLYKIIKLDSDIEELLNESAKKLDISARVYHKIIKISRTIADLDESEKIKEKHLLEALQYRPNSSYFTN